LFRVLKLVDDKFKHAPSAALELAFFGDAILGFIGLLLFGGTLAYCARQGRNVTARSIVAAALFGGIYATLLNELYWWHIEAPLLIDWIWILLMPVAAALLTTRQMVQNSAECLLALR
jgi:hypothetical protein